MAAGAVAGVVGTVVIEAASYGDILVRGRAPSDLPGQTARRLAATLRVDLGPPESDAARHRVDALGALLGYGAGAVIGALYGLVARRQGHGRLTGVALGIGAMVPANLPMVALGLTDPRTWGVAGWISDIVPHLAYGFATVETYRAITTEDG